MLQMTLGDIEKNYCEAKDRKKQIEILADLNGVESTFMAMLLREMGNDVDAMKLPRKPSLPICLRKIPMQKKSNRSFTELPQNEQSFAHFLPMSHCLTHLPTPIQTTNILSEYV